MSYLRYGFVKTLENSTFSDAVGQVRDALKGQGFVVVTELDVQKTMEGQLDVPFRRYLLWGACNPGLAKKALDLEPQIGLLLLCNVVIQEAPDKRVVVSIADPREMFTLVDNPSIVPIAIEAGRRLRRVMASLR